MSAVVIYSVVVLVMSIATFLMYGFDKRRAQAGGRRVPENTLHAMELLGGWPGALLGQKVFRHKTQKLSFKVVLWLCIALHNAAVFGVWYLLLR